MATHSKVECDLLALLLVVGVEAGLLVGGQLVSQSCRGDLGGEKGGQPVCDCCQLHGGLRVAMCVGVERGNVQKPLASFRRQQLSRRATLAVAVEHWIGELLCRPGTRER